jgi:hypothetical protein
MGRDTELAETIAPSLRDGDLVFLAIDNPLYREVARATSSWTSHVGLAFREADGWHVAESTVPRSRTTPLDNYLGKTANRRVAVRRLRDTLDRPAVERLRDQAQALMGRWYHLGFDYDSSWLFCSKFVYEVYRGALGREIGRVQTFEQLLSEHPSPALWFWRFWYFGRIPWRRRTVTPESQYRDPNLETVLELG